MLNKLENNKKWFVYFPLIIYWIILFTATTLPAEDLPKIGVGDKVEHFLAYFVLAALVNLTLMFQNKYNRLKKYAWLYTLIFCLAYAGIDELHQLFIPGRNCNIFDWLSDAGGILFGIGFIKLFISILRNKTKAG